jgi:hypothetical protein
MGYTHYWKKGKVTDDSTWKTFKTFVKKVVDKVKKDDGVILRDGLGEENPVITDSAIAFNGDGENGLSHETFAIDKQGTRGFDFCKTAYKPYDTAVVACLIEAERLGVVDEWSSDGGPDDHKLGRQLQEELTS